MKKLFAFLYDLNEETKGVLLAIISMLFIALTIVLAITTEIPPMVLAFFFLLALVGLAGAWMTSRKAKIIIIVAGVVLLFVWLIIEGTTGTTSNSGGCKRCGSSSNGYQGYCRSCFKSIMGEYD